MQQIIERQRRATGKVEDMICELESNINSMELDNSDDLDQVTNGFAVIGMVVMVAAALFVFCRAACGCVKFEN